MHRTDSAATTRACSLASSVKFRSGADWLAAPAVVNSKRPIYATPLAFVLIATTALLSLLSTPPSPICGASLLQDYTRLAGAVMANAKSFFPEEHPNFIGTYWGQVLYPEPSLRLHCEILHSGQASRLLSQLFAPCGG